MKKIIFLFLFIAIPVFVFGQSTGKIMSNRGSSYTLSVDTVNCNSKINFLQTTASITITIPNRTTSALCGSNISSGVTMYLSNIGSTSTTLSVSGSSSFTLSVNGLAILNWVGTKWTIVYVSPSGLGTFVKLAGDSMTGNLDMKTNQITNVSKINNTVSGDNIWFTPSSGLQVNSFSALILNSLNTTALSGSQVDLTPVNALRINTNSGSSFVTLSTTALSSSRSVNFPNKSGTFAYTSDLTGYMPIAAPNDTGIHSSASGPVGEYIPHRSTSIHGPPWNNLRTYSIGGGSYANPSAWTQVTQDPSNTYIQSQTGSNSSNLIVGSGTPVITLQAIGSGSSVGIASTNSGFYSRLRTTNLTADRIFEFPDSSGTLALNSSLGAYLPLTLSTSATVAMGSNNLTFTKSGNTVWRPSTGTTYDASGIESGDLFNRFLYDVSGGPVLSWANSSTSGVGITRVGNNSWIAYLKNSLLTADRTFQFPNSSDTLIGRNTTETLRNKTFITPNIGSATGSVSGNAGSATVLQTPRTINGTSFDGSANITISAAPSGTAGGVLSGTYPNPGVAAQTGTGSVFSMQASPVYTGYVTAPNYKVLNTGTGYDLLNTTDSLTNFERLRIYKASNVFRIESQFGGTGTYRNLYVGSSSQGLTFFSSNLTSNNGFITWHNGFSSSGATGFSVWNPISTSASGTPYIVGIGPTINQSSTAGYNGLMVSPFEQTIGAGNKFLLNLGTNTATGLGGTHTPKCVVDNTGGLIALKIRSGASIPATFDAQIQSVATTEQLRLNYDGSNYASFTTNSTGQLTISCTGTGTAIIIAQDMFSSPAGRGSSNMTWAAQGAQSSAISQAQLLVGGANTVYRVAERGSTTATPAAGVNYFSHIIGTQDATEASSGTHNIFTSLTIKTVSITNGTATTNKSATLLVDGANTQGVATNNYSILVRSGPSGFGGGIKVGDTTALPTALIHLAPSTAAAGTAPIKTSRGPVMTVAEQGAWENGLNGRLFFTPNTTRKNIPVSDTAVAVNGSLLIGNGTDYTVSSLTQGIDLIVTNGSGTIKVDADTTTGGTKLATQGFVTRSISSVSAPTVVPDGTDADYTAVVNSIKYLPAATLTANRTITIPAGTNGNSLEIYNNEAGFVYNLAGSAIYLSDGVTTLTSLLANTNYLIRKVSGKWRILN